MKNNLDKIYVLNHSDFTERKEYIEIKLKEQNIDFELVQRFHPKDIDYEKEINGWENFSDIEIVQSHGSYKNFSEKITTGQLSLLLKHKWCIENQLENKYENILILEDDCEIPPNFVDFLNQNMKEFLELKDKENVTVLMVGGYLFFVSKSKETGLVRYYENQKTRCTHAYIVNINAAEKILKNFTVMNLPIDFKLNEIMQIENIKVAWTEPGLKQIEFKKDGN